MILSLKQLCKSSNFYFSKTKAILKPLHSRLSCCLLSLIANDVFVPVRAHAWHHVTFYSYPLLTCSGGVLWVRGLTADNRVSAFHISCSSSLCQNLKKKKRWGDIWLTPGCEVEHQAPPERPQSAKGRNVMMCQPASRHAWLPARRRSPTRSVYIIDRMKNSNLSRMRPAHLDTMGLHMRAVFNSD